LPVSIREERKKKKRERGKTEGKGGRREAPLTPDPGIRCPGEISPFSNSSSFTKIKKREKKEKKGERTPGGQEKRGESR